MLQRWGRCGRSCYGDNWRAYHYHSWAGWGVKWMKRHCCSPQRPSMLLVHPPPWWLILTTTGRTAETGRMARVQHVLLPVCLSVWLNDGRHKMNLIVIGCALARTRSSPAPLAGFASSELVPLEGINSNYQPITLLCEIHCHNVACGCYFPSNWTPAASGYPPHVWNPIMHKCRCSGSQLHWFEWNHLRANN